MRKITQESINAFFDCKEFHKQNMSVDVYESDTKVISLLKLYNNTIAKLENGKLSITNAGWFSNTTKERLNALPNVNIYQKNFEWYFVSSYLADKLAEKGEVIIDYFSQPLWGRCTTGQAIMLDFVISHICEDMEILEGQKYEWKL